MITARYSIEIEDISLRYLTIRVDFEATEPSLKKFSLPKWIPGSYTIRDFAKHIVCVESISPSQPISKINTHTWQLEGSHKQVSLRYTVYANDPSIRGAYLGFDRLFANGCCLFMYPQGLDLSHIQVHLPYHPNFGSAKVHTTLPSIETDHRGFGHYVATSYDELIDHPIEVSQGRTLSFQVRHIPHQIHISGAFDSFDEERFCADLQQICEAQMALFHPHDQIIPFDRYLFLLHVRQDGYGGLEHRSSTALLCSPEMLPTKKIVIPDKNYQSLLGLCSHEYFHTWNVKQLKPKSFVHYELEQENDTSLLWFFEGFTAYFDDWFLRKTQLIDREAYLEILAKNWSLTNKYQGQFKQSLQEAGTDAWIKYYHPNENTPNAHVSYYVKGAVLAMYLDLWIRKKTQGAKGLDYLLYDLWQEHQDKGIDLVNIEEAINSIAQQPCHFLRAAIQQARGIELIELCDEVGLKLSPKLADLPNLGIKTENTPQGLRIQSIFEGEAAHQAGLTHGDILVALNHKAISTTEHLLQQLQKIPNNQTVQVHYFRNNSLQVCNISPQIATQEWRLEVQAHLTTEQEQILQNWLGT
jgi:predicted metalloprotease with PDZ domain